MQHGSETSFAFRLLIFQSPQYDHRFCIVHWCWVSKTTCKRSIITGYKKKHGPKSEIRNGNALTIEQCIIVQYCVHCVHCIFNYVLQHLNYYHAHRFPSLSINIVCCFVCLMQLIHTYYTDCDCERTIDTFPVPVYETEIPFEDYVANRCRDWCYICSWYSKRIMSKIGRTEAIIYFSNSDKIIICCCYGFIHLCYPQ